MPVRKVVTLYAPMGAGVAEVLLQSARMMMDKFGFPNWLSYEDLPHLSLMIECPQIWVDRSPTEGELKYFHDLYDDGKIEEAHAFAQEGWPEYMR